MKRIFTAVVASFLLAIMADKAIADSHTNAVLDTTFTLTAYVQENTNGPVWMVSSQKFGNADIINAVATDLGVSTSSFPNPKLLLKAEDVVTNFGVKFTIRANGTDTDISSNLQAIIPDQGVSWVRPAPFGRTTNATDLTIFEFYFVSTNVSFDIRGPAKLDSSSVVLNGKVLEKSPFSTHLSATVSGPGTVNGKDAVFTGTVKTTARKFEVQTTP